MTSTDRYLDLIDVAYDISDNPERFEDLLTIATKYLFTHEEGTIIAGDLPRYAGKDTRLDTHSNRFNKTLQEKLASANEQPANSFHAQIHITHKNFKVTGNLAAEQLTGKTFPCHIDELPFDRKNDIYLEKPCQCFCG